MAIEVFNRNEGKFLVNKEVYEEMEEKLLQYMDFDKNNKTQEFYTICNLYFDTKDNHLIRTSLSKPQYKEKLRLRSYGVPQDDEKVYLEIKKKVSGIVNKRRTAMHLEEAYEFLGSRKKPELKNYMNKQVINEIEYMLSHYELEPKLYLAYDRKAVFGREDRNLRITFDSNIRTRRQDLRLESGDYGEKLLENDQLLMEVKSEKNLPLWLSKLLSEKKLYKTSFSKYGREYQRQLQNNRNMEGEKNKCLNQFLMPCSTQQHLIHQFH